MNQKSFKLTTVSCFVGIFTQAILTNVTAILFVPLMSLYNFDYGKLGILVGVNFFTQVFVDISFSKVADRIGYRRIILPNCLLACAGLVVFALAPKLFPGNVFAGILIATLIFSFACGLFEILLSPIVAGIPGDTSPAMSLMHSFYAWGQVATIVLTTLAIFLFGNAAWRYIILAWALVPLIDFFLFSQSPFPQIIPQEHRQNMGDLILKPFFIVAFLAMITQGSAEMVMNQWASTFFEKGLNLPKLTGDLLGMTGLALMIGTGRLLCSLKSSKINLYKVLIFGSLLAGVCYLTLSLSTITAINLAACILCGLAVSELWPGTLVIASKEYPMAGAWMFALLAAGGDIGAGLGPWLTGVVVDHTLNSSVILPFINFLHITSEQGAIRLGLLSGFIFPVIALVCYICLNKLSSKSH